MHEHPDAAHGDIEAAAEERLPATFGYCCECGTWDSHGMTCAACGVDFRSGAEIDAAK